MRAFSLIELILAMAVMLILLLGVGSGLTATLRGTRKAGIATNVRSDGAYALNVLTQKIKFARRIKSCSTGGSNSITLVDQDETDLVLSYDSVNKSLTSGSTVLTSEAIDITTNAACAGVFTCNTANTVVTICFDGNNSTQEAKVNFNTQVFLLNSGL